MTTDAHAAHLDHESLPLRHALKERLIQIKTLRIELRLILGLAVAQLLVAALLLALKNLSGGPFDATVYAFEGDDGSQFISGAAFTVGVGVTAAAWALILAGAYRAGVLVRVLTLGAFGWAFWSERDAATTIGGSTQVLATALLAAVVLVGIVSWIPEHALTVRRRTDPNADAGRWRVARRLMVPLLFALVGGTYLVVWLASQQVGSDQSTVFSNDVFDQIDNIEYLLIPLLVLAGSDFGEWVNFALSRVARRLRTALPPLAFAAIAVALCAWIIFDGLGVAGSDQGGGVAQEAGLAALVFALGAGIYLLARPKSGWPRSVPFVAIAGVAVVDTVSGFFTQAVVGSGNGHLDDYIALVSSGIWGAAAIIGLVLLAVRRSRISAAAVAFVVFIGITDILGSIWILGNFDNPPLGISSDTAPYLGPEGLSALAAIATVLTVLVGLGLRRLTAWLVPISVLLVVSLSIRALTWIDVLYANKSKLEGVQLNQVGNLAIGGGVILLLALLWDLAVSGEAITNVDGRWLSRDTRVLMFLGYILLVSSAVLMFSTLHDERGALLESAFDPEVWVRQGILFLGIPLVLAAGLGALHRWGHQATKT